MPLQTLDTQLLLVVNHGMANAVFDILMPALSRRGFLLVIPFLALLVLRGANQRNEQGKTYVAAAVWTFLIACAAVSLSGFVEDALKVAIARERPCRTLPDIRFLIPCPGSYSLPSGHAISSFSFAVPIFYLSRPYVAIGWRTYPVVLACLIAFSRVYLGVHYPADVLAGAVLGGMIGMMLSMAYQVIGKKIIEQQNR